MPILSHNGGDQTLLRKVNLTAVLNNLRQFNPMSRTDLADMTHLNKATITRLVRELLEHRLVKEVGTRSSVMGSPSILLELDPNAGYIIGIRLDVDYSAVILTDFAAKIIWHSEKKHNPNDSQELIQSHLLELINAAINHVPYPERPILGLGLSVPGLVDEDKGTLLFAPNLGWHDVPLRSWLNTYFKFPIYADNEANLAALGETFFGAGRDCDYVLYINITYGVGSGIVLGQEILGGNNGVAGEVGHMTVDPNGPLCKCGNQGCWETLISTPAIFRRIRNLIEEGHPSSLTDGDLTNFSHLSIPLVVKAAQAGDPVAVQVLHETAQYIGLGLANLINILNPKRVILGGYLRPAYPIMLPEILEAVTRHALKWSRDNTDIVIAHQGNEASLMGTIAMIYNHVLTYPVETLARSGENGPSQRR